MKTDETTMTMEMEMEMESAVELWSMSSTADLLRRLSIDKSVILAMPSLAEEREFFLRTGDSLAEFRETLNQDRLVRMQAIEHILSQRNDHEC